MATPLLPKATAAWLVDNTALTFVQIGTFCGLHELEVQAIADGETLKIRPIDPIAANQLTLEEIKRCEADSAEDLVISTSKLPKPKSRTKGPRYTPVTKRGDKPNAIAWLLKNHPELSDAQIGKLIGTTKPTISKIRDKSHWNMQNIKARHPVELGLCSVADLEKVTAKAKARMEKLPDYMAAPENVVLNQGAPESVAAASDQPEIEDPFANGPLADTDTDIDDTDAYNSAITG